MHDPAYLLQQPLNECTKRYVEIIQPDPHDPRNGPQPGAPSRGQKCVQQHLDHLVPVAAFLRKRAMLGASRNALWRWRLSFWTRRWLSCKSSASEQCRPCPEHHDGCSRAFLLGLKLNDTHTHSFKRAHTHTHTLSLSLSRNPHACLELPRTELLGDGGLHEHVVWCQRQCFFWHARLQYATRATSSACSLRAGPSRSLSIAGHSAS